MMKLNQIKLKLQIRYCRSQLLHFVLTSTGKLTVTKKKRLHSTLTTSSRRIRTFIITNKFVQCRKKDFLTFPAVLPNVSVLHPSSALTSLDSVPFSPEFPYTNRDDEYTRNDDGEEFSITGNALNHHSTNQQRGAHGREESETRGNTTSREMGVCRKQGTTHGPRVGFGMEEHGQLGRLNI